jgi:hypothetical protein
LTSNKQGLNQSLIANINQGGKENMNHDDMVVERGMMAAHARRIDDPPIAFAHGDFAKWLLDSGVTSHGLGDIKRDRVMRESYLQ